MKLKNIFTLVLCLCAVQTSLATQLDQCEMSDTAKESQPNSELNEIEINKEVISHEELIAQFPIRAMERYFKFPNGFGLFIRSYKPGGHTGYNRPNWGFYKINANGRRILVNFNGRMEFVGTINTIELKSNWISFYESANEVSLCNRNVYGGFNQTRMLIFPDGYVLDSGFSRVALSKYSMPFANGESYKHGALTQEPPKKMISFKVIEAFFKNGEREVKESIVQPDGSVKETKTIEHLYTPINLIEAQFEGLKEPSILGSSGFEAKSSVFGVKF